MSKSPIDAYLDTVEWRQVPADGIDTSSDLPYATHEGAFAVAEFRLRVYQLNTGERIIDKNDMDKFFMGLLSCRMPKDKERK